MKSIFVEHFRSRKNTAAWFVKNLAVVFMIVFLLTSGYWFEVSKLFTWIILAVIAVFWVDYCVRNFFNK